MCKNNNFFLWIFVSILQNLVSQAASFFCPLTKFPHKFAGLKQPEPPEKISPISVASEQGLDTSV